MQPIRKRFLIGAVIALLQIGAAAQAPAHSEKPAFDAAGSFQFAIISDLWGGYREGIFEKAVPLLNLVQPDFVMCVGDLIDGKGGPEELKAQWDEFLDRLAPLDVRFYFTPGNHDYASPEKAAAYKKIIGDPYYSFDANGCHFLVLNSNDGKGNGVGIGEAQRDFAVADLEAHKGAAHTFIFLHHPVFLSMFTSAGMDPSLLPNSVKALYGARPGWEAIETALGARPFTVFAGHTHTYLRTQRKGQDCYVLSTTGAGQGEGGEAKFDHIVLVTVRQGKASAAPIKLDGFVPETFTGAESLAREAISLISEKGLKGLAGLGH